MFVVISSIIRSCFSLINHENKFRKDILLFSEEEGSINDIVHARYIQHHFLGNRDMIGFITGAAGSHEYAEGETLPCKVIRGDFFLSSSPTKYQIIQQYNKTIHFSWISLRLKCLSISFWLECIHGTTLVQKYLS